MTPDERCLGAIWPFVRAQLPAAPRTVAETGCGPLGGFVPMPRADAHQATGADPKAPEGPWFRPVEFERHVMPEGEFARLLPTPRPGS